MANLSVNYGAHRSSSHYWDIKTFCAFSWNLRTGSSDKKKAWWFSWCLQAFDSCVSLINYVAFIEFSEMGNSTVLEHVVSCRMKFTKVSQEPTCQICAAKYSRLPWAGLEVWCTNPIFSAIFVFFCCASEDICHSLVLLFPCSIVV